jgi:hypothetical protein
MSHSVQRHLPKPAGERPLTSIQTGRSKSLPADCGNSVDRNDPSEAAVQQGDYAATLRRTINSLSAP